MAIIVRPTTEDDWERLRALRLEALADTPIAYLKTHERALELGEADWREYAGRGGGHDRTIVAAIDEATGRFVGMMGGSLDRSGGSPYLVAVYVSPRFRGKSRGVTDLLLEAIEDWARPHGSTLQLDVHEDNDRARRYYEGRGFVLTGSSIPYPLDATRLELNMVKRL